MLGLEWGISLGGRGKPWMHEIFDVGGASVQSNAQIVKLIIKFEKRKIILSQSVCRNNAWIHSCQIPLP